MSLPDTLNRVLVAAALTVLLASCSTLPRDGPTGRAVEDGATAPTAAGSYAIVDLDYALSERIKVQAPPFFGSLMAASSDQASGEIGPGDILSVAVLDPSGNLFGSSSGNGQSVRSGNTALPPLVVSADGTVTVPFAGAVRVAGMSASEASAAIRRALAGKVANPQVVVSVSENTFNTVTVLGEVKTPGRAPLGVNTDRLIDAIAAAGGASRPTDDILVRVQRAGQAYTAPLAVVTSNFDENIRLARGDQVNLVFRPRRFATFGAFGVVAQTEMGAGPLSLAGALSKVGGLDTNSANARSVLVFRFERPEIAAILGLPQNPTVRGVPVVYRVNLEEGAGLFTANNFEIQADDILYVPRSGSAELGKFFTLVQTVTRVIYDVSVTSAVNVN